MAINYDMNEVQENEFTGEFHYPAGEYKACIVEHRYGATKKGDAMQTSLKWEILDGQYAGKKWWQWNILVEHPNETAQNIGRATIKKIASACGRPDAEDESEFYNIPVLLKLGVKDGKNVFYDVTNLRGEKVKKGVSVAGLAGRLGAKKGVEVESVTVKKTKKKVEEPELEADEDEDNIPF